MKKCCSNSNSPMVLVALSVQVPTRLTVLLHEWVHTAECPALLEGEERSRDLQVLAAMVRGCITRPEDYHVFCFRKNRSAVLLSIALNILASFPLISFTGGVTADYTICDWNIGNASTI